MPRFQYFLLTSLLILAVGLLVFIGYQYSSPPSETVVALNREISELHDEQEALANQLQEKESQIQATTRLANKILDDLAALADRKDLIYGVGVHPPAQLAADFPENESAVRAAESLFTRHLSLIESNLRDSQQRMSRMRSDDSVDPNTVAELESAIDRLRRITAERESTLVRFRSTVDSLSRVAASRESVIDTLQKEKEAFRSTTQALRQAYVAIGTRDELEEKGIIDKRFLRSSRIVDLSPDRFASASTTANRLPLPKGTTGAEILSVHRKSPELYALRDGALEIKDPAAFWAQSKYLVIRVERG